MSSDEWTQPHHGFRPSRRVRSTPALQECCTAEQSATMLDQMPLPRPRPALPARREGPTMTTRSFHAAPIAEPVSSARRALHGRSAGPAISAIEAGHQHDPGRLKTTELEASAGDEPGTQRERVAALARPQPIKAEMRQGRTAQPASRRARSGRLTPATSPPSPHFFTAKT